jgi:hypothetical protein
MLKINAEVLVTTSNPKNRQGGVPNAGQFGRVVRCITEGRKASEHWYEVQFAKGKAIYVESELAWVGDPQPSRTVVERVDLGDFTPRELELIAQKVAAELLDHMGHE